MIFNLCNQTYLQPYVVIDLKKNDYINHVGWMSSMLPTKSCIFGNICTLHCTGWLYKLGMQSVWYIKIISKTTTAVPFIRCNWDSNQMSKGQWMYIANHFTPQKVVCIFGCQYICSEVHDLTRVRSFKINSVEYCIQNNWG